MFGRPKLELKTPDQIRAMRESGLVVAATLAAVQEAAAPGITTAELNDVAAKTIAEAGGNPSFLNYGQPPYPGVICVSINHEIVHGLPGERVLLAGDLVSVDCGVNMNGWHGDSARSFIVAPERGDSSEVESRQALSEATYEALWSGIAALDSARILRDVSGAIEDSVDESRYGLVEEYTGHGIGSQLHMPPEVLNYRTSERGPKIKPGLCLAIEPMLTSGSAETEVAPDEWTVVTEDGSDAAHWEHTVAVTEAGLWVLTSPDGGKAELAERGVDVCPW